MTWIIFNMQITLIIDFIIAITGLPFQSFCNFKCFNLPFIQTEKRDRWKWYWGLRDKIDDNCSNWITQKPNLFWRRIEQFILIYFETLGSWITNVFDAVNKYIDTYCLSEIRFLLVFFSILFLFSDNESFLKIKV